MKKLAALTAALAAVSFASPAFAWIGKGDYEYKLDRFDGTQTATHDTTRNNCHLTKSLKGKLEACSFMKSTEGSGYSSLMMMKVNTNSWELISYPRSGDRPALLTLKDGSVIRKRIPAKLSTHVGSGFVSEWVIVSTSGIENYLPRLASLEVQYGSAEYKWTPTAKDLCVARLAKSC